MMETTANKYEEDLGYIRQLMYESRRSLADNGIGYIIWGILIVIGIMFNYFRLIGLTGVNPLYVWIGVIGIGWIITFADMKRGNKVMRARTMADRVIGAVWLSAGISMTMIGFLATTSGTIGGYAILPLMSVVLGIAYYVSGTIYSEKWIKLIALGWWLAAITFFFWKSIHSLAIFAFLMIMFQVLPGLYFYKKWKREMVSANNNREKN